MTSGDDTDRFNDDPTCAYVPGTGIANWGSGQENFGACCADVNSNEPIAANTPQPGTPDTTVGSVRLASMFKRCADFPVVLCLMLIMDETFNVRMGLFAPQWSRAGIGYTIILSVLPLHMSAHHR